MLEEIERDALSAQERARLRGDVGDAGAACDRAPLGHLPLDLGLGIQLAEDQRGHLRAGEDALLAPFDPRAGARFGINDRVGGRVPAPDVLGQRQPDQG